MTVATFDQPNNLTDTDPQDYKNKIDAAFAVHNQVAGQFAPHEAATPNMTVVIDAGSVCFHSSLSIHSQQTTSLITAPVTDPRIDRIVINPVNGNYFIVTGTEAASPVAPAIPRTYLPCCQFTLTPSTTAIVNSMIIDERAEMKESMFLDASSNIGVGCDMPSLVSGVNNIAVGDSALEAITTGANNVVIGHHAGESITVANSAVLIGLFAGGDMTAAAGIVGIGQYALASLTTGSYNTAVGNQALYSCTTGVHNTAFGWDAGGDITSGQGNSFFGSRAGWLNTGNNSVGVGYGALEDSTSANQCTAVGATALANVTTGDYNTALGQATGTTLTTGSNCTLIGYNADVSAAGASNEITLGNSAVTSLRCYDTTISSPSDARDKKNVAPLAEGLDFINTLRPVSWQWDRREWYENGIADGSKMEQHRRVGFIAQELQQAQQGREYLDLVYSSNPFKIEAKYGKLLPVMVKAIQDLSAQVEALRAQVKALQGGGQ